MERAIESGTVNAHLVLESVVLRYNIKPEPYSCQVGSYTVVGRIEPDWRRKEKGDVGGATRHEEWLVTRDTLPGNAEALVKTRKSIPKSISGGNVAPVEWARPTAR